MNIKCPECYSELRITPSNNGKFTFMDEKYFQAVLVKSSEETFNKIIMPMILTEAKRRVESLERQNSSLEEDLKVLRGIGDIK